MNTATNWKAIWNQQERTAESDFSTQSLLRISGFESVLKAEDFTQWMESLKSKRYKTVSSVFEIGCGAGMFLAFFSDRPTGGIDYSEPLVETIKKHMSGNFHLGDAEEMTTEDKYDNICAFSVFQYFNMEKAWRVLEKALQKMRPGGSIYIFDVPLTYTKKESEMYRFAAGLKPSLHQYYSPAFFVNFAKAHGLEVEIEKQDIPNYANSPFRFNVYLREKTTDGVQLDGLRD